MALALRTLPRVLRTAPSRLSSRRPSSARTMVVRAFKEEEKLDTNKAVEKKQEQTKEVSRPTADLSPVVPFRRLNQAFLDMQREMDYMMQHFGVMDPFMRTPFAMMEPLMSDLTPFTRGTVSRVAPLEVEEDDTCYKVSAEVPGFSKNDIKVTVDPRSNVVTITGQKETKEGGGNGKEGAQARMMRSATTFTRSFTLPQDVDPETDIKAAVEHGVLQITLPKAKEEEQAKKIKDIPIM